MRVSIWQQFSSNHSSKFTVVGRFGSPEQAEAVAQKLREWMKTIFWAEKPLGRLTETELKISRDYDLEWYKDGINWKFDPTQLPEIDISHIVRRIHNDVFLICSEETYDNPNPFVGLMWKLGARKTDFSSGESSYLSIELICIAPSKEIARHFYDQMLAYLKRSANIGHDLETPWWTKNSEDFTEARGAVGIVERKIRLMLQFYETGYGLCELVNYLEENGFTDIEYKFYRASFWSEQTIDHIQGNLDNRIEYDD